MSRTPSAPMIAVVAALASAWISAPSAQTPAPAVVELPAPSGRYPVATTSWRVTDRSRPETELLGRRSPLLAGTSALPDVAVRTVPSP